MEECLGLAADRGVRIVVNAGGLNPAGLAAALRELAGRLGPARRGRATSRATTCCRGPRARAGQPLTANAYLGAFGIAECLRAGADVVVTGRVTDASLVVGPGIAHFGWGRDDLDALAGAVVAGHVLECGAQATGGNLSFFDEHPLEQLLHPGFPLAELAADGSCVITKHPGTGGVVDRDTVTAQLLYEIAGPRYAGPDVVARFDTIRLHRRRAGPGARSPASAASRRRPRSRSASTRSAATATRSPSCSPVDRIAAKAAFARAQFEAALPARPAELALVDGRDRAAGRRHRGRRERAAALRGARPVGRGRRPGVQRRRRRDGAGRLSRASTSPRRPATASPFGVYTAAYVPQDAVPHVAVLPDGTRVDVPPPTRPPRTRRHAAPHTERDASRAGGPTRRAPLGAVARARSGDKGGTANVGRLGPHGRRPRAWLAATLTPETAPRAAARGRRAAGRRCTRCRTCAR